MDKRRMQSFNLVKRTLVNVLANKVEDGMFTADDAVEAAKGLLFQNPMSLYGLNV